MAKDKPCLVTRDDTGLFLGVHAPDEEFSRTGMLGRAVRADQVLVVTGAEYSFSTALALIQRRTASKGMDDALRPPDEVRKLAGNEVGYPTVGLTPRLKKSIDAATSFVSYNKRIGTSTIAYFKRAMDVARNVYFRDDEPLCTVPLSVVREVFGNRWFLVNNTAVQIVSNIGDKKIRSLARRALDIAEANYMTPVAAGSYCLRRAVPKRIVQDNPPKKPRHKRFVSQSPRYVVRSAHGVYLGAYSIIDAKKRWPKCRRDNSVILVPGKLNGTAMMQSVEDAKWPPNGYKNERLVNSARTARNRMLKMGALETAKSMGRLKDAQVRVFADSSRAVESVPFSCLKLAFGNEWFIVNETTVQLTDVIARGEAYAKVKRVLAADSPFTSKEDKSSRKAKRQKAEQSAQPSVIQEDERTKTFPRTAYAVLLAEGVVVYQCGKAKFEHVRDYFNKKLPTNSYVLTPHELRLTVNLQQLGYSNEEALRKECVAAAKGIPAKSSVVTTKAKDTSSNEPIQFDGPAQVLYIRKSAGYCRRNGHKLSSATGEIVTLKGRPVRINVTYCASCRKYFLGYAEYQHYRDLYGPVLGNFSFYSEGSGFSRGFSGMAQESPLMLCGYSVSQASGLSEGERRLILANIMDRGICDKPRVMDYLQFFINSRSGMPNMGLACERWQDDLDWVRNYRIDKQSRFRVSSVRR